MSAVMEVEKEQQDAIVNFRPPRVEAGTLVKWFREADRSSSGYVALVRSVGDRAIHLQILNADTPWLMNSVHHIDDPELKARKGLRQYGAWDFTPDSKAIAERLDKLEKAVEMRERLAGITRRLDTLESELGVGAKKTDTQMRTAAEAKIDSDAKKGKA